MESMDETDPSLNTHPNTEPASDSISNNSSATTTQIEPEPEIYLSDEPDSSDTDTDSTIFVKGSEDDSDATIPNTSILIDSDNKKNSRNDPENQPSSSSVVEIPINSVKRSYDVMKYDRDDNDQICPICLDMWTSEGDHRLCSLKCGHLFGKSCIFNWLVKQKKKCCPQCNKDASSYDIRELFATKLIAMDCSEKTRLEREIEAVREEKRKVEVELAKSRLYAENFKLEVNKLQTELAKYRGKTENSSTKKFLKFHLEKTLIINEGLCRVCAYDSWNNALLVCHKKKNPLFPDYGIKRIQNLGSDYNGNNFLHLHSRTIRDIRFHPFEANLILTVAFDQNAKIYNLGSQKFVQTFTADYALWSCCWDEEDLDFIYVGTGNGAVHLFNIHNSQEPVTTLKLWRDTSSVVSICYVHHKPNVRPKGGIICCRLNSVVFYKKSDSNEFTCCRFNSLVGPFFSLIFDSKTDHMMVSCRPSASVANVRHIYCKLEGDECQPIHVFIGGTIQSIISRPCFVKLDTETLVAVYQESSSSIELWDTSSGFKVSAFHVNEEILDLTFMTVKERTFLVAIASSVVKFYEAS